jgi:calpain, invertebrate
MGANEGLLSQCFWKLDTFKEYGLFVCRFYKDCSIVYVIIDDKVPVKAKDGKPIFASSRDPNVLWVPLIEKAYAKLHGCYKALIGGYSHFALADMTGYTPRLIVVKPGFIGYSEPWTEDQVWDLLVRYRRWGCLMGCSIQSNPKENHKVEAEAGLGLFYSHAYSLLDVNEIPLHDGKGSQKLVKLRNPW